jgi:hypothetical protein
MTEDSAERYDTQVEVLFNGSANAIRRQLCRRSTRSLPVEISAPCGFWTWAAAQDGSWTS